ERLRAGCAWAESLCLGSVTRARLKWCVRRPEGKGDAEFDLRWDRGSLGRRHPLVFLLRRWPARGRSLRRRAGGWHGVRSAPAWRRLVLPHQRHPECETGRAEARTAKKKAKAKR